MISLHPAALQVAEQVADLRLGQLVEQPLGHERDVRRLGLPRQRRGRSIVFWRLLSTRVSDRSFSSTTRPVRTRPSRRAIVCDWYSLRTRVLGSTRLVMQEIEVAAVGAGEVRADRFPSSKSLWQTAQFSLKIGLPRAALPLSPSGSRPRISAIRRFFSGEPVRGHLAPGRFQAGQQRRVGNLGDQLDVRRRSGPWRRSRRCSIASSSARPTPGAMQSNPRIRPRTAGAAERVALEQRRGRRRLR